MAVVDRISTSRVPTLSITGFGPLHLIAALGASITVWASAGPLDDYDSFFHVKLGGLILSEHRITGLPSAWLGVPEPSGWITSQWLSEVIMHLVVTSAGWPGLLTLRVLVTAAFTVALGVSLLRHRPAPVAVPIYLIALISSAGSLQSRPQTAGLLFLVGLGPVCIRLWTTGRRPPIAVIVVGSLFWAQLHGSWILAPAAFLLVAVGLQLDSGRRPAPQLRSTLICLLASMAGVVNPQGLGSFLLPLRFSRAASSITEWWPTTLSSGFTLSWALMVLTIVVVWARSALPVPRVELLWVLAWTGFGTMSYRNVTPALLMTAPVAVLVLTRWFDQRRVGRADPQSPQVDPSRIGPTRRESLILGLASATLLLAATIAALISASAVDPFATTPGARIAAWVAAQPAPIRVFNTWNASGALIGLSEGKALLVIDNRVDLWGDAYNTRIQDAQAMRPGWEKTISDFRPQAVVTPRISAVVSGLTAQGWRVELTDADLVLLLPSSSPSTAD